MQFMLTTKLSSSCSMWTCAYGFKNCWTFSDDFIFSLAWTVVWHEKKPLANISCRAIDRVKRSNGKSGIASGYAFSQIKAVKNCIFFFFFVIKCDAMLRWLFAGQVKSNNIHCIWYSYEKLLGEIFFFLLLRMYRKVIVLILMLYQKLNRC